MENAQYYLTNIGVVGFLIGTIYLCKQSEILRDLSTSSPRPYSFSRTQLMWWTVIVVACCGIALGYNGAIPALNKTVMILLGIGLTTTASARVIDNSQNGVNAKRFQNEGTDGFLRDILSDEQGVSIQRFQAFVFNIIYGIAFIVKFLSGKFQFPEFDDFALAVMGISSAAYLGLKLNENKK